jgi:hypothetical protein
MTEDKDDSIFVWNAPSIEKPEFRLYYDELGSIICYSGDKFEGNYIVVDAQTFAEGRYDLRIIDGKVIKNSTHATIVRLTPSDTGTLCAVEDLSVIVAEEDEVEKQYWKLTVYEF